MKTYNEVLMTGPGEISSANSSETSIDNGGSFTGSWQEVGGYDSIVVSVATDQDGYYEVRFSPDGTNVDSTLTRYYRTAQINVPHRFTITRKYCQVRFFNNSGSNQTYFRLQTLVGSKGDLNIPVDSTMAQDYDAISVRPSNFHTEVALGRRQGVTTWNKFGYNEAVSNSDEIVASWGGAFAYLTSGTTIDIVSDNSADDGDPAGTGANSIIIYGVDENWLEQTETVTLNGVSTVTTTSQWIGINRISIASAGSGKTNAGTINVTANGSGEQMAQMPAGQGTSQQCIYYVPANNQFLAEWLYLNAVKDSGGGNPEITFKGMVYSDVSGAEYEVYRDVIDTARDNRLELTPTMPFVIGEKSIFWLTANSSTGVSSVRGRFSGETFRDPDA